MKNLKAITILQDMLVNGPAYDADYGICANLTYTGRRANLTYVDGYGIVVRHSYSWKHFSGIPNFPIPNTDESTGLWKGKQLVLRTSLIKHIISKLEELS